MFAESVGGKWPAYRPLRERGVEALDAKIRALAAKKIAIEKDIAALRRAREILNDT